MSLRILVVDDEESNIQIISIALRCRGHHVMEAYDPESALRLARSERPEVILMDLMFKGASMDGIEAIRRLKADPATARIPVIAQTASVLEFSELCVRGAGAEGFIRKPFRRQELLETIEQVLATSQAPVMRYPGAASHDRRFPAPRGTQLPSPRRR